MTANLHCEMSRDPAAPPVLLLCSLGSHLHMWDPQIPALSAHHHVVAIDHRGHGGSAGPAGSSTITDLAGDVSALHARLEIASMRFVGLPLGGAVGQWLAAHGPGRIRTARERKLGVLTPTDIKAAPLSLSAELRSRFP